MINKSLFYYIIETDKKLYSKILKLFNKIENFNNIERTDEQIIFMKDFYLKLLFEIAVLEYRKYSDDEIIKILNLNEKIQLLNRESLKKLKSEYNNVLNEFYKILNKTYENVIIIE